MAGCASAPVHQKPWIEVRTAHFEILSNAGRKQTLALAERLEAFRAIVQFTTHLHVLDPVTPVRLYIFSSSEEYANFGPPDTKGVSLPGTRAYLMAIDASALGTETRELLRHEYTHFLIRNVSNLSIPRWYDEGFAELLSTVEFDDENIDVGKVSETIRRHIQLPYELPLARVMQTESFEGMSGVAIDAFYGKSWSMVHYAIFDTHSDSTQRHAQLSSYLHLIEEGRSPEDALRRSFGGSFKQLARLVKRHSSSAQLPYKKVSLESLQLDTQRELRTLSEDEVATALAELSIEVRSAALRNGLTQHILEQALLRNPNYARAHALLGRVLQSQGLAKEAQQAFQRALALDAANPLNQIDYGDFLLLEAFGEGHSLQERRDMVRDAREHFLAAYRANNDLPEPLAQIAKTYLTPEADPAAGIPYAEGAHQRLPSSTEVNTLLGTVYLQSNYPDKARAAFLRAIRSTHSPSEAARIRTIMTRAEKK